MAGHEHTPDDLRRFEELGNYLPVSGYNWNIGGVIVQDLDESPAIRKQVARYNALLKLMGWEIVPIVFPIDGKPVVPLIPLGLTVEAFPHSQLAALVSVSEVVAEELVTGAGKGTYKASYEGKLSKEGLLKAANISLEAIKDVLPTVAENGHKEINLIVPHLSGAARPVRLPATEDVRKPDNPVGQPLATKKTIEGMVVGPVPMEGIVVLDSGRWIRVVNEYSPEVRIGGLYSFEETGSAQSIQKRVAQVNCLQEVEVEQGDIFDADQ